VNGPADECERRSICGKSRVTKDFKSFVRLRKLPVDQALMLDVIDPGDAEMLLNNPRHLGEAARLLLKRGFMPTEDGWGGWLGRYQAALRKTAREIGAERAGLGSHATAPPWALPWTMTAVIPAAE
jgi:hypothetical protein